MACRLKLPATVCAAIVAQVLCSSAVKAQQWAVSQGLTRERVIGLLNLPDILGPECVPSNRATSPVFSRASRGTPIGMIASRNCQLIVRRVTNDSAEEIPTEESGYESPAAIVYQREGLWFRIALREGSAWVVGTDPKQFLPYPEILRDHLGYLRSGWDGRLWKAPGATGATIDISARWKSHASRNIPIDFLGSRRLGNDLWIHIRLGTESCGETLEGVSAVEGWVPAYRSPEAPVAWFYSRGC
jgi:hypothetical protein